MTSTITKQALKALTKQQKQDLEDGTCNTYLFSREQMIEAIEYIKRRIKELTH